MKKIIWILIAVAMLLTLPSPAFAKTGTVTYYGALVKWRKMPVRSD